MWRIEIEVADRARETFEAALAGLGVAVASERRGTGWQVSVLCPERPRAEALTAALAIAARVAGVGEPQARLAPLADRDWVAESLRTLTAVRVGRFTVRGAHLAPERIAGRIDLCIDAGPAFGTGHHPTTAGCLEAIERWQPPRLRKVLDMGCGAGVLAIAISRLWHCPVQAVDNDPVAVAATRANAARNGVGPLVTAMVADGFRAPGLAPRGGYDLIVANILARPLVAMAGAMAKNSAPGGAVILSGLLASQANQVMAAYRARGFRLARRRVVSEWVTLTLVRPRTWCRQARGRGNGGRRARPRPA